MLTDPWRGQPLKSWVRSRGWTEDELDAACDFLRSRGLLDGDELTPAGWELREEIESATDHMERRVVDAVGDDADELFTLLDPWCDQIVAAGGYPRRVGWPTRPCVLDPGSSLPGDGTENPRGTDPVARRLVRSVAMVRPFRFGLQLHELGDLETLVTAARDAARLGYAEVFSSDHIGRPDPFVPLVVAAGAVPGLRVGPLVLNNELHQPALLARTAATVDALTGGRLVLGLGTGYDQSEPTPPGSRCARPAPACGGSASRSPCCGRCSTTGRRRSTASSTKWPSTTSGAAGAGARPVPDRRPRPAGGRLAGRLADIFQFTGLTHGDDGAPGPGGFRLADVLRRGEWLEEAAGDRDAGSSGRRWCRSRTSERGPTPHSTSSAPASRSSGRSSTRPRSYSPAPSSRSSTRSSGCGRRPGSATSWSAKPKASPRSSPRSPGDDRSAHDPEHGGVMADELIEIEDKQTLSREAAAARLRELADQL